MKNFSDFKSTISQEDLLKISNEITDNLNKIEPQLDVIEYNRSFNLSLTMRLLEKYHNWLNN
ncbi:hypothetical protein [Clostridium cadaveris]|uniref:hypothetical protein n=1 Tax=Clostridium cadaveris TaxID=1529 RepID=UPI0004004C85|nr:hypothetical protein [Clostridium cadaveris]UFH63890.1 hypothetical protein KQH81_11055 [Clostridium cadaveris]